MVSPGQIRVSDAERDEVLDRLRTALGEGRLDADEFSERADTALAAKTFDDLRSLTDDLPAAPSRPLGGSTAMATRSPGPVARRAAGGWPALLASPFGRLLGMVVLIALVLGSLFSVRHGAMPLPLFFLVFFLVRGGLGRGRRR